MSQNQDRHASSRREFLKTTGRIAAASALAGVVVPHVHAGENNTIQVALVGCGGRGTGAAANALSVKNGPIKLVAMADVFADRLNGSYNNLKKQFGDKVDVPDERQVHRLRRLPEGDGLPEAGRRGHLRHAAGLPLGAFHLRHREGPQRLHGEAAHGRRPHFPPDAEARRGGVGQEPQGGRGLDVAPQPGAAGTGTSASRTARSATSCSCAATACTGRSARPSRTEAGRQPASCSTRSSGSTASSGPAAAASAISTSTSSTIAAG